MEEKITIRKVPGTYFSILLFLFFYLLLRTTWRIVSLIDNDMLDAAIAEDEPIIWTLILSSMNLLFQGLSFWSLIRVLKGEADGITCLRWALGLNIPILLYQFFESLGKVIYLNWMFAMPSILQFAITIVFLVYLAKSNHIKQTYPQEERKYAPGGWLWVSFLFAYIGFFVYMSASLVAKQARTSMINVKELRIPAGYYCDGTIMFKSHPTWTKTTKRILDFNHNEQEVTEWSSKTGTSLCKLWSGESEKARHSDFMWFLLQSRPAPDSLFVGEVSSLDTIIGTDQYYVDQYQFAEDSISILWTFAARFDSKSNKFCVHSKCDENGNAKKEMAGAIHMLKDILFDLTQYKK